MKCQRCGGFLYQETTISEGEWVTFIKCLHCGEYVWPDSLRWSRAINLSIYRAREVKTYRSFESAHRWGHVKGFSVKKGDHI
jgi:uncharacterized Zn finger protein